MSPPDGETAPWNEFEKALTRLCESWNSGRFFPLLEPDVAGYLYHTLLVQFGEDASCWHLDTRMNGAKANDKYDLVYGPVSSVAKLRPVVSGSLVVEMKFFAAGFTPAQQSVHFRHALEDIARLQTLAELCPDGRAALLVDAESYLKSERRMRIVDAQGDPRLRIYLCGRLATRQITWERVMK